MVFLWFGGLVVADQGLDFFVFLVGEDADHGHHAHHASAPVGGKAMGFGLRNAFRIVHSHFHEGILRKAGHGVGVFGDGGVMDVLDAEVVGKCLHLTEGFGVGGVGGLDLTIA